LDSFGIDGDFVFFLFGVIVADDFKTRRVPGFGAVDGDEPEMGLMATITPNKKKTKSPSIPNESNIG
jgi:hypothetical protein